MSKSILDALLVLASVIIGGMITYLTTRSLENKRWKQQKTDKLQELRREALGLALEWIPPIEIALSQATMTSSGFLQKQVSEGMYIEFLEYTAKVLEPEYMQNRLEYYDW